MSVLIIEVKRNRQSVTQGSATVFINGTAAMTFGDEMYLKNKDGTFSDGFKTIESAQHYGEVIDGWGSITPDSSFILGLLYHPYDPVYHHSDIVRKAILAMDEELTFNEIVTPELKARIYDLFEKHDKMIEEQDEYIERLRDEVKQLKKENRLIDENAAAVQKEYKAEIERLQSAYLRAVTERDNAIFQLTRREAERDKAVEDMRKCRGNKCDYCYYSSKNQNTPCRDCQSPISNCGDKWKWRGLEESE